MILSAGRGERMGALTANTPKPLLELGGRTLIARHLDGLARAGVEQVVVNVSYAAPAIRRALGDGAAWNLKILYSEEGEPALGTGGGIIQALPLLGSAPFILVNADVLSDFDFEALTWIATTPTLVLVSNPPHHRHGDFGLTASAFLSHAPPLLTYAGIALLDPAMFAAYPRGRRALRPILDAAIERGLLKGLRYDGLWIDVGTPERLDEASRAVEAAGS